jgi:hypothetical protein
MRNRYPLATLVVGFVAATSLGVSVALVASGAVPDRGVADTATTAASGTATTAGGGGASRAGARPAGAGAARTGGGAQDKLSQPDLIAKVKPSVVRLVGPSGAGSGWSSTTTVAWS